MLFRSLGLNGSSASNYGALIGGYSNGTPAWFIGSYGTINSGTSTFLAMKNSTGGVYLNGSSATAWTAISDERLKENLVPIADGLNKVCTLRAVVGNYTWDTEKVKKPFLTAQDVQSVLPEAETITHEIVEKNRKITEVEVYLEEKKSVIRKVVYNWGGVYYYNVDNKIISEDQFYSIIRNSKKR